MAPLKLSTVLIILGLGAGDAEKGASHGGEGGDNQGTTYGSTTSPTDVGSGCSTVRGGGVISIKATTLSIDGVISADGESSFSTGAGSGGSIKVTGDSLEGHGIISVNGGSSTNKGGGGGGCLALDVKVVTSFYGGLEAKGGRGGKSSGAAGTVYKLYQITGGASKSALVIYNDGLVTDSRTIVNGVIKVSELEITGKSKLIFDTSGSPNVEIELVEGDKTGLLTIQSGQYFVIATSYGTQYAFSLPCKIVVEGGGYATLPAQLLLEDDTDDDEYNLDVQGNVIALRNLVVGVNSKAYLSYSARSGLTTTQPSDVGTFSLTQLEVTTGGKLEVSQDSTSKYTLDVLDELNIKYGGEISARNLFIQVPTMQVAYDGLLSVDGSNGNLGTGAGQDGSGGSHGGSGGTSSSGGTIVKQYTGSLFTADAFGSTGGNKSLSGVGGPGGGMVKLKVTKQLTLDGVISSHGNSGMNGGGGGSGGSVSIEIVDMLGAGSVSVVGGNAIGGGGGGGGGRIYLMCTGDYNYTGVYKLKGGNSDTGQAGGSGTAYLQYPYSNIQFRKLFTSNSMVTGSTVAATYFDTPGTPLVELDEMEVGDKTTIKVTTAGLHVIASTLVCGANSLLNVQDNVIFSADVESSYSKLTCSLHIDEHGEARLPKTVELLGANNEFKGEALSLYDIETKLFSCQNNLLCL